MGLEKTKKLISEVGGGEFIRHLRVHYGSLWQHSKNIPFENGCSKYWADVSINLPCVLK